MIVQKNCFRISTEIHVWDSHFARFNTPIKPPNLKIFALLFKFPYISLHDCILINKTVYVTLLCYLPTVVSGNHNTQYLKFAFITFPCTVS